MTVNVAFHLVTYKKFLKGCSERKADSAFTVFAVLSLLGATSIAHLMLVLTDLEVLCQGSDWL